MSSGHIPRLTNKPSQKLIAQLAVHCGNIQRDQAYVLTVCVAQGASFCVHPYEKALPAAWHHVESALIAFADVGFRVPGPRYVALRAREENVYKIVCGRYTCGPQVVRLKSVFAGRGEDAPDLR
jgi:hypothetical protein